MYFDDDLYTSHVNKFDTFWLGDTPPLPDFFASVKCLDPKLNFRENPQNHNKFDKVFITEYSIGGSDAWPIILDEAIRLLKQQTKVELIIRVEPEAKFTIAEFSNHLSSKLALEILGKRQNLLDDGTIFLKISLIRREVSGDIRELDFAMITNGERNEVVRGFIKSVENLANPTKIKLGLIICGPSELKDAFSSQMLDLKYLSQPLANNEYGWITKKKNMLVKASTASHIVVMHDRYLVDKNFLLALDEFGWDFDLLVPNQFAKKNGDFPAWVATQYKWNGGVNFQIPENIYHPNLYINGGALLARRGLLAQFPWDELLMWNQGEDVELTRRLQASGYVPRFARNLRLLALVKQRDYVSGFIPAKGRIDIRHDLSLIEINSARIALSRLTGRLIGSKVFLTIASLKPVLYFKSTKIGRLLGGMLYSLAQK